MRKLFYCVVALTVVLVIASCQENKQANIVFERVEGMMDDYPDSALAILDSMRKESEGYPRSQKMKFELLCAKAQNKAYVDFTTDSVMKEVVEYYDDHGTPNEQMEAHYLLGCVYRDLKESPMALSCYLDATEKADTLSEDCDYDALMRVWGQIADEYDRQCMPLKELEANKKFREIALNCCDTLNYIVGVEMDRRAYLLMRDTINALCSHDEAFALYIKHGYIENAKNTIPLIMPIYINKHDFTKVDSLFSFYNRNSLYNHNKKVCDDLNIYNKALFFEKTNVLDSAEYYYQKLLSLDYEFESYSGLLNIYSKLSIPDSICKYSKLKDSSFDETFTNWHTQAMFNADGMYNYARNQRLAEQNFRLANRNRNIIYVMTIVIIIVSAVSFSIYCHYKSKKKIELESLNMNFLKVSERYEAAKKDLVQMGEDYSGFRKAKAEELSALQQQLTQINSQYNSLKHKDKIDALKNSSAFLAIKNKLDPRQKNNLVSDSEWDELTLLVGQCLPAFYSRITNENQLSKQELQVTILTKLGFSSNDIALLLDKPAQRISNAKAASNLKLFGDNSARTFVVNVETL